MAGKHSQSALNSAGPRVYAYLGVTCHLHFWQSDRGILRATAITRGVERSPSKNQHRKSQQTKGNNIARQTRDARTKTGIGYGLTKKVNSGEENSPAAPAGNRNLSKTLPALYQLSYPDPYHRKGQLTYITKESQLHRK